MQPHPAPTPVPKTLLNHPRAPKAATSWSPGLDRLIGEWQGTGVVTLGSARLTIGAHWKVGTTALDKGLLGHLRFLGLPGTPVCEQTDVFGWDGHDRQIHWMSLRSSGETYDRKGGFDGRDTVRFNHAREEVTLRFVGSRVLEVTFVSGPDSVCRLVLSKK